MNRKKQWYHELCLNQLEQRFISVLSLRVCLPHLRWSSDGSGKFDLAEAEGLKVGSKIVIYLNGEAQDFAKEDHVKEIVEKYR